MPCTTIYGRLPPQDDSVGVDGIGCTNLSGLLTERFALLALMGIRCFWPHKIIGRTGLVVHQAWKLRPLPASHQYSPRILSQPWVRAAPQGTAYSSLRLSKTQAIRAVLLARATIVRLKPRRATSAFSQVDCLVMLGQPADDGACAMDQLAPEIVVRASSDAAEPWLAASCILPGH